MLTRIDLNSDMGERDTPEGLAIDADMMPLLTSVNIACGGHAGNASLMRRTAHLAAQHGVAIGAHPGFHDPDNFGRVELSLSPHDIHTAVVDQVAALTDVLARERYAIRHVKPHGALYAMAAKSPEVAQAIVTAVQAIDPRLRLYALAGSVLAQAAQALGLLVVHEAFADRAYRADGTLVPRTEPGALLTSEESVRRQLRQLIKGSVTSIEGAAVLIKAGSVCLHADTPQAVSFARLIRQELESAGIRLTAATHAST